MCALASEFVDSERLLVGTLLMQRWLTRCRTCLCLLAISACLALAQLLDPATANDWLYPALLAALAIAMLGTKLRVRPMSGSLAVSDLFAFGAVVSVPVLVAPALAVLIAVVGSRAEQDQRSVAGPRPLQILAAALNAVAVGSLHPWLASQVGDWFAFPVAAAIYLGLSALGESLRHLTVYRRRLLWARIVSSFALAVVFIPAAVLVANGSVILIPWSRIPWIWAVGPPLAVLYVVLELRWGPVYVDTFRRDEMEALYLRAVEALALAVEAKDSVSGTHLKRVQFYSVEIGKALNCSESEIRALEFGALLHDIGKIAVPEELLSKPSRLSPQEFSQVASHVEIGAEILSAVNFPFPVAELVRCHHESWNGSGYPRGLKGHEIPRAARILTVVDNFDALTSDRPYRPALTLERAVEILQARRGSLFDAQVVDVLVELLPRLETELSRNREFRRGRFESFYSHKQQRGWVEQVSLTAQERLESLKQSRTVARQSTDSVQSGALARLQASLASSLSRRELIEFLLPVLAENVVFDECTAFLVEGRGLKTVYCSGPKGAILQGIVVPVDNSPTGWAAAHGRTLLNGNPAGEHADLGRVASLLGLQSALVTPLWASGKVVGTLNLYSRETGHFSKEDAGTVEDLTKELGSPLQEAPPFSDAEQGQIDPLTELPNARQVLRTLRAEVDLAVRSGDVVSVLCVDVDRFRMLNSRRGHSVGDQILADLARMIEDELHDFDFFARLGGDRFVALATGLDPPQLRSSVRQLASTARLRFDQISLGLDSPLSISVGGACFPEESGSAETLLLTAYQRLYQEKLTRGPTILGTHGSALVAMTSTV